MKKNLFIIVMLVLSLGLALNSCSQKGQGFKTITARVVTVHSWGQDLPFTMTVKTKVGWGKKDKEESFTIDPRCSFYKDDKKPKTIDTVKPGDTIKITYLVSEGVKVAFNVVVMPEN